jgi:hypothetical protein
MAAARLFLFSDQEKTLRGDILADNWVNGRDELVKLDVLK